MPMIFVAAGVGAAVGAGVVYGILKSELDQRAVAPQQGAQPVGAQVYHSALKYGMPIKERVRTFEGFVASFDGATRNPVWVLDHFNKASANGDGDRKKSQFKEDGIIPARFRSKLTDYRGSGYDRGHMAPAMLHKGSQAAMDDTFTLTNMSPQVGKGFNQDYWARFEKFVKDLSKRADDVYVVTGPLYTPVPSPSGGLKMDHRVIGQFPETVSVPTHYFKVILAEGRDKDGQPQVSVGAFVMPNAPIDPSQPLLAYAMPLDVVESVSGLQFFPGYINDVRRDALDSAAVGWRKLGGAQQRALTQRPLAITDSYSASDRQVALPSGPSHGELMSVGVWSGPAQYRPPATGKRGMGSVHLCEAHACRLPAENFWEAQGGGKGGGGSGRRGRPPAAAAA